MAREEGSLQVIVVAVTNIIQEADMVAVDLVVVDMEAVDMEVVVMAEVAQDTVEAVQDTAENTN